MIKKCADCFFKFEPNKGGENAKVCPSCRQARKDKWRRDKEKMKNFKIPEKTATPPRSNIKNRAKQNEELRKQTGNTE